MAIRKTITARGNITIEAAIVVPTMLIILATLLMASLLIHDMYVIKTDNSLRADRWVIAGESGLEDAGCVSFIIEPLFSNRLDGQAFWQGTSYKSTVEGDGSLDFFPVTFEAYDQRDYKVRSPKSLIRAIDFVDDATDRWTTSNRLKRSYEDQVSDLEGLIRGGEGK